MNLTKNISRLSLSFLAIAALSGQLARAQTAGDPYEEKATAIVKPMRFTEADKTERAIHLTTNYLRQLEILVNQRQASLEQKGKAGGKTPEVNHQTDTAWQICRDSTIPLRDAYVAQLSAIMTPAQVDRVKDGITRDWYHADLQRFDRMVPNLSYAERAHVVGLLTEMRENAMLEIDSKLQVQWVHKYRGIINNYIAAQGHDFTELAKAYKATYEQ